MDIRQTISQLDSRHEQPQVEKLKSVYRAAYSLPNSGDEMKHLIIKETFIGIHKLEDSSVIFDKQLQAHNQSFHQVFG